MPKGFLLPEGELQAASIGLPTKALREAIVNAVMHRSYREHRPVQVIRYDNRIEIINPGYSLKSEVLLGHPGSETRNLFIAEVFHETNLAETKGSGIRAMRRLMSASHLAPPTFNSDRNGNQFVSRLLLHQFLDKKDLLWLEQFKKFNLNDGQKQALIFVREVGAIDNHTYRQMNDCDTLKASTELRALRSFELLSPKGKGKGTYYIAGTTLKVNLQEPNTPPSIPNTPAHPLNTPPSTYVPPILLQKINNLGSRVNDADKIKDLVRQLCEHQALSAVQIAKIFGKEESYFKRQYLSPMIKKGILFYTFPEMINHPNQSYTAKKN